MTIAQIVNIILGVLSVVISFIGYYFYIRQKVSQAATNAVNDAEQDGKTGKEKLQAATEQVYAIIPAVMKPIIPRTVVEGLVQAAFDKIEEYANKQVKKKFDKK